MISVTNRIRVKKGMGEQLAPMFAKPGPLQQFEGFEKVEVHVSTQFEEYDEMQVMMYWQNEEGFQAWRESDAFKQAHKRPENGEQDSNSPVIGSTIVVAKVAAAIDKAK